MIMLAKVYATLYNMLTLIAGTIQNNNLWLNVRMELVRQGQESTLFDFLIACRGSAHGKPRHCHGVPRHSFHGIRRQDGGLAVGRRGLAVGRRENPPHGESTRNARAISTAISTANPPAISTAIPTANLHGKPWRSPRQPRR